MNELLRIDRVFKSHWRGPHETIVLADVCLHVHAGELVLIWGQRGSGKTTLARLAAGLEQPDRGAVRFEGQELKRPRRGSTPLLHEGIGWVRRVGSSSEELRTVADYVAFPLLGKHSPRSARRRAATILQRMGVGDCAEARWESLTDGQRTLVSIAHALAREPRLLVADDPTAYLNALQREEVMRLFRAACVEEGLGILLMVPDMPEMAHADQIASLSEGRLVMPRDPGERNVIAFPGREQSA
ncbi:MAG: ATP-binding cassette domain-containing protein [Solirubrobacterales bacterium]